VVGEVARRARVRPQHRLHCGVSGYVRVTTSDPDDAADAWRTAQLVRVAVLRGRRRTGDGRRGAITSTSFQSVNVTPEQTEQSDSQVLILRYAAVRIAYHQHSVDIYSIWKEKKCVD
jgi:hypothetical protein